MKNLLIVDGNSLIHRAFYALPLLSNGQGEFTNAAYGFTTMFSRIIADEKPDFVVVCFDKGRVTFRTEQYQAYKGQRKATPEELRPQFPLVKKILTAMNVAFVEMEGFEADDLIGTIVRKGEKEGLRNLVLTGDKDALQLVSPLTMVLLIRKGISEMERYDENGVYQRFGLTPEQVIDLKGLMGDPSDNIPGVPGIGEKTAIKLLQQYQTVENLYHYLEEVSPKLRDKLQVNQELAVLSKKLATIDCCVPIDIDFGELTYRQPDYDQLLSLYKDLEFKSLIKGILERMATATKGISQVSDKNREKEDNFQQLADADDICRMIKGIMDEDKIAIYVTHRGNYAAGDISSLSFALSEDRAYAAFLDGNHDQEKLSALKELFERETIKKVVYNAKDLQVMLSQRNLSFKGLTSDVMLGAYLLNPGSSEYSLESLCLEYLNRALVAREDEVQDHCARAQVVWQLVQVIEKNLAESGMDRLYRQIELPLEKVLAKMEIAGVKVESSQLVKMSQELESAIQQVSEDIYRQAGEEFNINSPKQLAAILFEKLGLPPLKKTKTGYSTNAEVLERLASQHEIVAKILEHRTLVKLKSTYVDGLQPLIIQKTGKLHTSFNQTVTATGRPSSRVRKLSRRLHRQS